MVLQPRPGFNWMAVSWGAPDEPRSETCCYCDALLPEEGDVPLILFRDGGWCAEFCTHCQRTWWGMQPG